MSTIIIITPPPPPPPDKPQRAPGDGDELLARLARIEAKLDELLAR
jgi:hypothetical protein